MRDIIGYHILCKGRTKRSDLVQHRQLASDLGTHGFHAVAGLEFSLDAESVSYVLFDLLCLSYESLHSAFRDPPG